MRSTLAPLVAALLAAAGLYGTLAAAARTLPPSTDRWLDAWQAAGLKAEFRAETPDPSKTLLFMEARKLFESPGLRDLAVRQYLVSQTGAHVVVLPDAKSLIDDLPEGRHFDHKLKPKGGTAHVCRVEAQLLVVSSQTRWIPFIGGTKTSKKNIEAIFEAFEGAAR